MRGRNTRRTSPKLKLHRPKFNDVHGEITSFTSPAEHAAGTGSVGATQQSALALPDQDPLAGLYPNGLGKTYYRGKAQAAEAVMDQISEPLLNEPDVREKLKAQLIGQAGGPGNVTPTLSAKIESIAENRILRVKVVRALAKHGSIRVNKNGTIAGQSIIKDLLLPLDAAIRLDMKAFVDEVARRGVGEMGGQRYPYSVDNDSDGTQEGDMKALNDMNLLLVGQEQTLDEIRNDFKAWGHKTPLADGSLPQVPPAQKPDE